MSSSPYRTTANHLAAAGIAAILVAAASTAAGIQARAAEAGATTNPSIQLNGDDGQSWQQIPGAMDACIAGIELRNDPTVCRGLSSYLSGFSARVRQVFSVKTDVPQRPPMPPAKPANPAGSSEPAPGPAASPPEPATAAPAPTGG